MSYVTLSLWYYDVWDALSFIEHYEAREPKKLSRNMVFPNSIMARFMSMVFSCGCHIARRGHGFGHISCATLNSASCAVGLWDLQAYGRKLADFPHTHEQLLQSRKLADFPHEQLQGREVDLWLTFANVNARHNLRHTSSFLLRSLQWARSFLLSV